MGPRPTRRGARAEGDLGTAPRPSAQATRADAVERVVLRCVVKPANRHAPTPDTAPLPDAVVGALAAIAGDLRHLPHDCIIDKAELLVWLRRMAGRVDGVAALRMTLSPPRPKRAPPVPAGRDLAEAVFGPSGARGGTATRTVTGRRGRQVAVETRRARERGQIELPW